MENTKIQFNDTPQLRGFASEKFTWVLDKESGISCCWGKTAKENPNYDEIGPEILNWKISQQQFNIEKYIKYFNFLTNIQIKNEEKNEAIFCTETNFNKLLKIKDSLICMSTFGNAIFNIDLNILLNNIKNLEKFFKYIKLFNIKPKLIIEYKNEDFKIKNDLIQKNIKNILKLTDNIIIKINPVYIEYQDILNIYNILSNNKILTSFQISISNDNYGQIKKLLENIPNNISITLNFNCLPFVTLEKYFKIQNLCKQKNLINVVMTQCSKKHFSKRVIGSVLHEIECPAARFSIFINNNVISPCQFSTNILFNLDNCKSIHDFWSSNEFTIIKNNLTFNGMCKVGEINKK